MNICFSQTCKLRLLLLSSSRGASKSECFCNSFFRQATRVMSSSTDEVMWVGAQPHTHAAPRTSTHATTQTHTYAHTQAHTHAHAHTHTYTRRHKHTNTLSDCLP